MFGPFTNSRKPRAVLLPVILFGVLLVSILIAWGLARSRSIPAREAEAILAEVRKNGLAAYWQPYAVRWWLIQAAGQAVGWRATAVVGRGGAAFEGVHVHVRAGADTTVGHWEWWRLNADATTGEYRAGKLVRTLLAWQILTDTTIRLTGGRVSARQQIHQWVLESQARAPNNYLPEGTLELAARLVAQRKTQAQFRLIFNEDPPLEQTTRFRTVRLEYAGPVGGEARVNLGIPGTGKQPEKAYFFDSSGRLLRETHGDALLIPVPQEQVTARFPDAAAIVVSVMQKAGFLFTPETAPSPLRFSGPEEPSTAPETEADEEGGPML